MKNYINKEFALAQSPRTGEEWNKVSELSRVEKISSLLKAHSEYSFFEVVNAYDNGHIILKTDKQIPANQRGLLILELESIMKVKIDEGITLWLEPVGDKSKLRNLRGIELK